MMPGSKLIGELSSQESAVLTQASCGNSDKEIAKILDISEESVRTYWHRIRKKVGNGTRAEIIAKILSADMKSQADAADRQHALLSEEILRRRQAETKFAALADSAPLGIFVTDQYGSCTYVNPEYTKCAGISSESAKGIGWLLAIHPDDRQRVGQEWNDCATQDIPYRSKHRFKHKDGRIVWTSVQASKISIEGTIVGYVGMVEDISAQVQKENSLEREARSAREVAEASLDAFFVFEPIYQGGVIVDFRISFASSQAEILFGKSSASITGRLLTEAFPSPGIRAYVDIYARVLATGDAYEAEVIAETEGPGKYLHVKASRITAGIAVAVQDISETRRLQRSLEKRVGELHGAVAENRRIRHQLQSILDSIPAMVGYWDTDLRNRFANRSYEDWFGMAASEMYGLHISEVIGEDLFQKNRFFMDRALTGEPQFFDRLITSPDGRQRYSSAAYIPDLTSDGVAGFYVLVFDVTAQKKAESAIAQAEQNLRSILNNMPVGVVSAAPCGEVTFVNEAAASLLESEPAELVGLPLDEVLVLAPDLDEVEERSRLSKAFEFGVPVETSPNCRLRSRTGKVFSVKGGATPVRSVDGAISDVVIAFQDVSAERNSAQLLKRQALHDSLTGLPNRAVMEERLAKEILDAGKCGGSCSVVFMDLDRFKQVNDTYGHDAGDVLLKQVSERILDKVRATDTVCRIGGDEFVLLLPKSNATIAESTAERVVQSLSEPFELPLVNGLTTVEVGSSFGTATYPDDGSTSMEILKRADERMYKLKIASKSSVA